MTLCVRRRAFKQAILVFFGKAGAERAIEQIGQQPRHQFRALFIIKTQRAHADFRFHWRQIEARCAASVGVSCLDTELR